MSNVKRFVKKPVFVEAVQWTGTNETEVRAFCPSAEMMERNELLCKVVGGKQVAKIGYYIAKNAKGEYGVYETEYFESGYTPIVDDEMPETSIENYGESAVMNKAIDLSNQLRANGWSHVIVYCNNDNESITKISVIKRDDNESVCNALVEMVQSMASNIALEEGDLL